MFFSFKSRISTDARDLHATIPVADVHTHAMFTGHFLGRDLSRRHAAPFGWNPLMNHMDLPRSREGSLRLAAFTMYGVAPFGAYDLAYRAVNRMLDSYERVLAGHPGEIGMATTAAGLRRLLDAGKMATFVAVEGGHALGTRIENLKALYDRGVRMLTLTHFVTNQIAASCSCPWRPYTGLSAFGREVVADMNRLGMIVDLSHISEVGFWEVLELATAPLIASHSGVRKLCRIERNLSDDMLRALAAKGGVLGITFYPRYLSEGVLTTSWERIVDHIEHVVQTVGPDHVCLGSDFDGFIWTPEGIRDVTDLPIITQGLLERGYDEPTIRKILHGNVMRLFAMLDNPAT